MRAITFMKREVAIKAFGEDDLGEVRMTNAEMMDVARLVGLHPRSGRYHDCLEAVVKRDVATSWDEVEKAEMEAAAKIGEVLETLFGGKLATYLKDSTDFMNDREMEDLMLTYINKRIDNDTTGEIYGTGSI